MAGSNRRGWWRVGAVLGAPLLLAIVIRVAIPLATGRTTSPYMVFTFLGTVMGGWVVGLAWLFRPHRGVWRLVATAIETGSGDVRDGQEAALWGAVAPGPAGPLRAPLSGLECVWWLVS